MPDTKSELRFIKTDIITCEKLKGKFDPKSGECLVEVKVLPDGSKIIKGGEEE